MTDILNRLLESSAQESTHELMCRINDAAKEIIRMREAEKMRALHAAEPDIQKLYGMPGVYALIQDLHDEADLCANEHADDIAKLLTRAAYKIEGLVSVFRVNILRLSPQTSHAEITKLLDDA